MIASTGGASRAETGIGVSPKGAPRTDALGASATAAVNSIVGG